MGEDFLHLPPDEQASILHASYTHYEACQSGGLRLIPKAPLLEVLPGDYPKMIAAGMFDGEPPSFDSILNRLDTLEKEINRC